MPIFTMTPRVTPVAITTDAGFLAVQGFREGTISTTDFFQRMVNAGRAFAATCGSATTPITANTTYAAAQPQFALRVPLATAAMPVYVSISREVSTGTINEWSILVNQNDIGIGTSSAGTVGPISLRTDSPVTSNCTVRTNYTGNATAATNPIEIWRTGQELATAAGAFDSPDPLMWSAKATGIAPLLIGAASLQVNTESTTTAQQYFLTCVWVETPSNWWT